MDKEPSYTSADAIADLGGKPTDDEVERLTKYYPTYQFIHRKQLLQGLFNGASHEELVLGKITAKGLDTSMSKQAKGGHGRWVVAKVRKATIRILYLRYRIDSGMTRRKANQKLVKEYESLDDKNTHQSMIRKATHSPVLDGNVEL